MQYTKKSTLYKSVLHKHSESVYLYTNTRFLPCMRNTSRVMWFGVGPYDMLVDQKNI